MVPSLGELRQSASLEFGVERILLATRNHPLFFRPQHRKQNHIPNRLRPSEQHHQPIDANPQPSAGGMPCRSAG